MGISDSERRGRSPEALYTVVIENTIRAQMGAFQGPDYRWVYSKPRPFSSAVGQRRERVRGIGNLSLPSARLAMTSFVLDRNQAHHWLLPSGDHDLFALAGFLNQTRKLGLSLVDGNDFHRHMLANAVSYANQRGGGTTDCGIIQLGPFACYFLTENQYPRKTRP